MAQAPKKKPVAPSNSPVRDRLRKLQDELTDSITRYERETGFEAIGISLQRMPAGRRRLLYDVAVAIAIREGE